MRVGRMTVAVIRILRSSALCGYFLFVASLLVVVSCGSDVTANQDQSGDVTSITGSLEPGLSLVAGGPPVSVTVAAHSATNTVANVLVHWEVSTGGGSVSVQESRTDRYGAATTMWTLPTKVGTYTLSASVGTLTPMVFVFPVKAGAAATHTLATDTLRFTAQTQLRALSLTGRDQYGNDSPLGFTGFTSNLVDVVTSGQNISLKSRTGLATHARGWGRFDWASGPSDSVAIIVDLAPASAAVVGLDTLVGAVVGQKLAVAANVRDSLNQAIVAPDITGSGATLSSSNPSVATVDAATDTITALAIGNTIITASLGGSQFTGTLAVYNRWDVGPFSQLYAGLADAMYSRLIQTLYDDGGTSIETIGHLPHSANPSSGTEVDSHGAHSWTRSSNAIIAMGLAPTGQVYLLDSTNAVLHGLDPNTGLDLWTLATPGAAALETTLDGDAIVRSPTSLTRVSTAGHATWSVALSSPAQHVAVGPTSVFAIAADQISAISLSGTRLWSAAVTTYAFATDRSGGLYVTTTTPELIALSPSGTEQWRFSLGEPAAFDHADVRGNSRAAWSEWNADCAESGDGGRGVVAPTGRGSHQRCCDRQRATCRRGARLSLQDRRGNGRGDLSDVVVAFRLRFPDSARRAPVPRRGYGRSGDGDAGGVRAPTASRPLSRVGHPRRDVLANHKRRRRAGTRRVEQVNGVRALDDQKILNQ